MMAICGSSRANQKPVKELAPVKIRMSVPRCAEGRHMVRGQAIFLRPNNIKGRVVPPDDALMRG
jgi:hypothetical protein